MAADTESSRLVRDAFSRHRLSWLDSLPWVAVVVLYFAANTYLPLGTQVMISIIFALALDLALGYGGIATLGHAAFFGLGAYAAGLYALDVSTEPISGLVAAGIAGAIGGLLAGPLVLRTRGLTLVMLTLAVATLLHELANSFKSVTGGADGLFGYKIAPLLGLFPFDLAGRTAYWYGAAVMAVVFFLCKALVNSPFGLAVKGIRENPVRMRMLGVPVTTRLVMLYAISGAFAAVAGGLSAQVTRLVGLDSLTFTLSGNVLVMLILGGTGSLYGAFLGATLFVVLSDRAAAIDPFNWLFAVGIVLILAVRYAPKGLVGLIEQLAARLGWKGERRMTAFALELDRVSKSFGALRVARDFSLALKQGARHALIGPNGAGKTTLVNLVTGLLEPSSGAIRLDGIDITALAPERRVALGLARTFQISSLFPQLSVAENVALALEPRLGLDSNMFGRVRGRAALVDGTAALLDSLGLLALAPRRVADLPYGQRRLVEIALVLALEPKTLLLDEPAAGLASSDRHAVLDLLLRLPPSLTILVIEHDMSLVFRLAQRITVMVEGAVLVEGTPAEIRVNHEVRDVYLGTRAHG